MPKYIDADKFLQDNAYFADRDFVNPKYDDTLRDLIDGAPAADVEPKQRWISVTDNPPKVGGEYWTLRYFKRLPIIQPLKYGVPDGFDNEYFYSHDDEWGEDTAYCGVTHWLPLSAIPELPKGEDNAEEQTT